MTEFFDVIDEDDKVIDKKPRIEVHTKGLWHRVIYVFNSKGELFIQHRSETKDVEPGLWDGSVSGHPSSGQGYDEAVVRESKEEIGVDLKPQRMFSMTYEPYAHRIWVYKATHNGPFRLDPEELQGGRFCSLDNVMKDMKENPGKFSPEFVKVFKESMDKGLFDRLPKDRGL